MNDFILHRLKTDIDSFKQKKIQLEHNLSRLEPDMDREIDIVERKYGGMRVTLESKIKQLESDIRKNEIQLQQLEKKNEREQRR